MISAFRVGCCLEGTSGSATGVGHAAPRLVSGFPETVLLEQGVGEDDELSHHGRDGDLGGFARVFEIRYVFFMSGLNRIAASAGM